LPAGTHYIFVDGDSGGGGGFDLTVKIAPTFAWTLLKPSADTRSIWVSSKPGASDTAAGGGPNNCLTQAAPCRTLAHARTQLRNGQPDWLLLEKGSTFAEALLDWDRSGRSAAEPMVLASYGAGTRPRIHSGNNSGFAKYDGVQVKHLQIVGLYFKAERRDPAQCPSATFTVRGQSSIGTYTDELDGLQWRSSEATPDEDILIEDCYFEQYHFNLSIQAQTPNGLSQKSPIRNFRIRGNVIVDAWAYQYDWECCWVTDVDSSGIYSDNIDGLVLEGNVLSHNGGLINTHDDPRKLPPSCSTPACTADSTKSAVCLGTQQNPGRYYGSAWTPGTRPSASMSTVPIRFHAHTRTHQAYINSLVRNAVFSGNIISEGEGAQLRGGGDFVDNFVFRTTRGYDHGVATTLTAGGVSGRIADNVFYGGTDFPDPNPGIGGPRGSGVEITNVKASADPTTIPSVPVRNNLFLHDASAHPYGYAIRVSGADPHQGIPPFSCTPTIVNGATYVPRYCTVSDVWIENNIVYSWRGGFQFWGDPDRGGATRDLRRIKVTGNILQNPVDDTASLLEHNARCGMIGPASCTQPYAFNPFVYSGQRYWRGGMAEWFRINDGPAVALTQWPPGGGLASQVAFRGQSSAVTLGTFRELASGMLDALGIGYKNSDPTSTAEMVFLREARRQGRDSWRPSFFAPVINSAFRRWYTPCPPGATKC
jgi:hypothetical protein